MAKKKLTRAETASRFGVDVRTVFRWEKKGMPTLGRGMCDADAVDAWFRDFQDSGGKSVSLAEAETRLKTAEAELKEIKLAQARGELIPREMVANALGQIFSSVQSRFTGYSKRLIPQLAIPQKFWPEAIATADRILYEILDDLAEAKDVPRIVAESAKSTEVGDEAPEAAVETDREPVGRPAPKAKPRGQRRARTVVHKSR